MFPIPPARAVIPAQAVAFHSDVKAERLFHEYRRMKTRIKEYVGSRPRLLSLGEDPLVDHLLSAAGFDKLEVVVQRVAAGEAKVTAICVPRRLWRDAATKAALLDVKREAAGSGTRCILVPQGWLKANIRSSVARAISQARQVSYTRSQRERLIAYIAAARFSTIIETAAVLDDHEDPVSVVLALSSAGFLILDRSRPLAGNTLVTKCL